MAKKRTGKGEKSIPTIAELKISNPEFFVGPKYNRRLKAGIAAKIPGLLKKGEAQAPDLVKNFTARWRLATGGKLDEFSVEALKWFQREVSKNTKVNGNRLFTDQSNYKKIEGGGAMIGKMYLYKYKAVDTGIWDALPLVFFFNMSTSNDGYSLLHGVNVHYLPLPLRTKFLLELMKLKTSKKKGAKARLRMTWNLIKGVSKSNAYKGAVHTYRVDRIKSQLIEIPMYNWNVVNYLRIAKFQNGNEQDAFNQTSRRIK